MIIIEHCEFFFVAFLCMFLAPEAGTYRVVTDLGLVNVDGVN